LVAVELSEAVIQQTGPIDVLEKGVLLQFFSSLAAAAQSLKLVGLQELNE